MNTIRNNVEILAALGDVLNDFYSVTATNFALRLQGKFTQAKVDKFTSLGFEFNYDAEDDWYTSVKQLKDINLEITLTK